jgi:hypothetical protein
LEFRLELCQGARQQVGADPQNPTDGQNQEAVARADEDAVAVEQENPSRPLQGAPSIREVSEQGAGRQGRERLEEDITSDLPECERRIAGQQSLSE